MGRTPHLHRLSPKLLNEINRLLSEGRFTLDEIVEHLRSMGVDSVSRSALGRQKQKLEKVAAKLRQNKEITEALTRECGASSVEGMQGRMLVNILRTLVYDCLQTRIVDGEEIDPKQFMALGRALKDMAQAARLDQDFETRIRERVEREAEAKLREAAKTVADAPDAARLTPELMLERILQTYNGEG